MSMHENFGHNKKRRFFNKKFMLFIGFLFVVFIILFTTFYRGGFSITGNMIKSIDIENSLAISSSLSVPDLSLDGDYGRIKIIGTGGSDIRFGSQDVSLSDSERNDIVIENFSGEISFNEEGIYLLDGRALRIIVNRVPISSPKNRKVRVSIGSEILYSSIEFRDDVYIKELSYITSGNLLIDNHNTISLNGDSLLVNNYLGKLAVSDKKMNINGLFESLDVLSDNKMISISYKS